MKKKLPVLALLALVLTMLFVVPTEAMSSTYKQIPYRGSLKCWTKYFALSQAKEDGPNNYSLYLSTNGETRRVLQGIEPVCYTNGVYVYYYRVEADLGGGYTYNSIYRYNTVSRNSAKLLTGRNYVVRGAFAEFLYMGNDNGADGVNMWAYNTQTGGRKFMYTSVGSLQIEDRRVLVTTQTGAMGNYPVYIFNLNGMNKIKIANACSAKIVDGKVFYVQYDAPTDRFQLKMCDLDGTNKTTVRPWGETLPQF